MREFTQTVISDVYEDVSRMVRALAYRFARSRNLDCDETAAHANLLFMQAYHGYNPDRGTTLRTHVWNVVSRGLQDQYRQQSGLRNRFRLHQADVDLTKIAVTVRHFDLSELMADLTDDAKTVLQLLFSTELDSDIQKRKPTPAKIRYTLRRYLIDNLHWATDQILSAFAEIQEALE